MRLWKFLLMLFAVSLTVGSATALNATNITLSSVPPLAVTVEPSTGLYDFLYLLLNLFLGLASVYTLVNYLSAYRLLVPILSLMVAAMSGAGVFILLQLIIAFIMVFENVKEAQRV